MNFLSRLFTKKKLIFCKICVHRETSRMQYRCFHPSSAREILNIMEKSLIYGFMSNRNKNNDCKLFIEEDANV